MKKFILLAVGVSLLAGCSSGGKKENVKTNSSTKETTEMTSSSKEESKTKDEPESVEFVAKGDYIVGTDIEPGTYYAVLTELSHGERDTDKNAYVSMNVRGNTRKSEMLRDVGAKQRLILKEGDTITFDDNYSPSSWTVSFLNDSDFKKYMGGKDTDTSSSSSKEAPSSSSKESTPSSTKEETKASEKSESTAFKPTDVSDETIKSIKTYEDYLAMYQAIINNFLSEYEAAVKDTVLYDQASFEEQKKQYDQALESQKKQYSSYGNKKLAGKDTLVDFLISYRDSLTEMTKSMKESLQ